MPVRRRSVEFSLPPTWLGVVVAPTSDMVALRTVQDGFLVVNDPYGLALSPPSERAEDLGMLPARPTTSISWSNRATSPCNASAGWLLTTRWCRRSLADSGGRMWRGRYCVARHGRRGRSAVADGGNR